MPRDNGEYVVRTPAEIEADRHEPSSMCSRCFGEIPHGGTCTSCGNERYARDDDR